MAQYPQVGKSIADPEVFDQPPPAYSAQSLYSSPNRTVEQQSLQTPRPVSLEQHPSTASSSKSLLKPIAIPATDSKLGSPFLRAYPPSLKNFALPTEVFLRFLDDLNRVAVASPPLQVLGLAGTIVSFVPLQTAQIVGGVVNAAATVGTVAISKGRTEVFLRQANKEIFQPRGLKVEIAKIQALAKVAEMPILNAEGKIDKNSSILAPIEDLEATRSMTGQERRLQAIEPWVAHLDLAPLSDIDVPTNPLSKLSVAVSKRQRKEGEEKMHKHRYKAYDEYKKQISKNEKEYEKEMRKLEHEEEKIWRKEKPKDIEKKLKEVEKERQKVDKEFQKETNKIEKDRRKEDEEEKGMRKILWLVIRNFDADSGPGTDPYTDEAGESGGY